MAAKSKEEKAEETPQTPEEVQAAALKVLKEYRKKQVVLWLGPTVMSLIENHPKSPFIRGGVIQKMNMVVPDDVTEIVDWLVENKGW